MMAILLCLVIVGLVLLALVLVQVGRARSSIVNLVSLFRIMFSRSENDLGRLSRKADQLMTALSDKIAEVNTHADAAAQRVLDDVATLNAKIDELKTEVAGGTATPEDIAALDALEKKIDGIDPAKPAPPPPPPAGP
jgi:hypothetical protein